MVKRSVRETKNPRNLEEKMFIGYIDLSFSSDSLRSFTSLYKKFFNIKDYPLNDSSVLSYSNTNHTVVISLYLKELPGNAVGAFLEKLPTVFNVVEG